MHSVIKPISGNNTQGPGDEGNSPIGRMGTWIWSPNTAQVPVSRSRPKKDEQHEGDGVLATTTTQQEKNDTLAWGQVRTGCG